VSLLFDYIAKVVNTSEGKNRKQKKREQKLPLDYTQKTRGVL